MKCSAWLDMCNQRGPWMNTLRPWAPESEMHCLWHGYNVMSLMPTCALHLWASGRNKIQLMMLTRALLPRPRSVACKIIGEKTKRPPNNLWVWTHFSVYQPHVPPLSLPTTTCTPATTPSVGTTSSVTKDGNPTPKATCVHSTSWLEQKSSQTVSRSRGVYVQSLAPGLAHGH